jgi:hypothetical protein
MTQITDLQSHWLKHITGGPGKGIQPVLLSSEEMGQQKGCGLWDQYVICTV